MSLRRKKKQSEPTLYDKFFMSIQHTQTPRSVLLTGLGPNTALRSVLTFNVFVLSRTKAGVTLGEWVSMFGLTFDYEFRRVALGCLVPIGGLDFRPRCSVPRFDPAVQSRCLVSRTDSESSSRYLSDLLFPISGLHRTEGIKHFKTSSVSCSIAMLVIHRLIYGYTWSRTNICERSSCTMMMHYLIRSKRMSKSSHYRNIQ